jgi:hypothetical protein
VISNRSRSALSRAVSYGVGVGVGVGVAVGVDAAGLGGAGSSYSGGGSVGRPCAPPQAVAASAHHPRNPAMRLMGARL